VLALDAGRAHADPLYTITNLGQHSAVGLNNLGDVVGNVGSPIYRYEPAGYPTIGDPYVYHSSGPAAGTFTDLSSVLGASALVQGINDSGQIAGTVSTPDGYRGFLDSAGQVTLVPPSPGGPSISDVRAMNNSGDLVGVYDGRGFLYQDGRTVNLGNVTPTAISDNGIVAGHGFVSQDGKMTPITAGISVDPSWVNNAGQVVGSYHLSVPQNHAFVYQNGQLTDLGTLGGQSSGAMAINSQGQVVGYSETTSGPFHYHAFLSQNGSLTDLNGLIPTSSRWNLEWAVAINDKGQIVGYGTGPDGREDSFLLTPASQPSPVPEPSMLAFFALAAAGMAFRRAWRRR
jgi:probable HAF family extracellular repeat protein